MDTFYYIEMTCDDPNISLKYDDDIEFIVYIYIYVPFKILGIEFIGETTNLDFGHFQR